jgi:hypothetical protein
MKDAEEGNPAEELNGFCSHAKAFLMGKAGF